MKKKIPPKIKKSIEEFLKEANKMFGDRAKKLYFMVPMQEEILIQVLILIL